LIKNQDPNLVKQSSAEIACAWLALGLDTDRSVFYRAAALRDFVGSRRTPAYCAMGGYNGAHQPFAEHGGQPQPACSVPTAARNANRHWGSKLLPRLVRAS